MADLEDIYGEIGSSLLFSVNDGMASWDKERGTYALDWTDDDIPMLLTWKGKDYFLRITPREVPCAACGQPGNSDEMMSTMAGVDHGGYLCSNIDGCNKRIAEEEK